jgi:hypothetical protein
MFELFSLQGLLLLPTHPHTSNSNDADDNLIVVIDFRSSANVPITGTKEARVK